jgi:alpha-ribazole phosphatase/probable phosphoglycerate mutase
VSRVVLVRHCEPDESVRGRSYGALDVPLSAAGHEQARAIADALRGIRLDAVLASPLRRALETAAPLALARGLEPVVHEGLRELSFGAIEGLSYDEIARERPELFESWMTNPTGTRFPEGESFSDLRERALAAATEIRSEHESAAIVAHGGVTRMILAAALEMPDHAVFRLDQPYGAVSIVDWIDDSAVVRAVNLGYVAP